VVVILDTKTKILFLKFHMCQLKRIGWKNQLISSHYKIDLTQW